MVTSHGSRDILLQRSVIDRREAAQPASRLLPNNHQLHGTDGDRRQEDPGQARVHGAES